MANYPEIEIKSYRGLYNVQFISNPFERIKAYDEKTIFIIDELVESLYAEQFKEALGGLPVLRVKATEENKNFKRMEGYIDQLLEFGIRRDKKLVAIGGGITQDITCFLASTLFRGVFWEFFPTTLLAQADSCIGSKSSINYGNVKNLLGTFCPPNRVHVSVSFLRTLEKKEIQSGIGEMIKVHFLNNYDTFKNLANEFDQINEWEVLEKFLYDSLLYKKNFIEIDEFDSGIRNVMNYGHTFGHAIESATHFGVPHGIAVTIGMDMANSFAHKKGWLDDELYQTSKRCLELNYKDYRNVHIERDTFFSAISKDKKNVNGKLALIIPYENNKIEKVLFENNDEFKTFCNDFFQGLGV